MRTPELTGRAKEKPEGASIVSIAGDKSEIVPYLGGHKGTIFSNRGNEMQTTFD